MKVDELIRSLIDLRASVGNIDVEIYNLNRDVSASILDVRVDSWGWGGNVISITI